LSLQPWSWPFADERRGDIGWIKLDDGITFEGTWEEIVDKMRDANCLKETPKPEQDAESFIRRSADAGLLRILR